MEKVIEICIGGEGLRCDFIYSRYTSILLGVTSPVDYSTSKNPGWRKYSALMASLVDDRYDLFI